VLLRLMLDEVALNLLNGNANPNCTRAFS
jgi:hypothetical protein